MAVQAEITGVDEGYAPAPVGTWRVTVRFHNGGMAAFVHAGIAAPKVGEVWEFAEPRLLTLAQPAPSSKIKDTSGA